MLRSIKVKVLLTAAFLLFLFSGSLSVYAEETKESSYEIDGDSYQLEGGDWFSYSDLSPSSELAFGRHSLGTATLDGNIVMRTQYGGCDAFVANGDVTFNYNFSNYEELKKQDWKLESDKPNNVLGYDISDLWKWNQFQNYGVVVTETSVDGINWTIGDYQDEVYTDFLSEEGITYNELDPEQYNSGLFYRLTFMYKMHQGGVLDTFKKENSKRFIEVYTFYICAPGEVSSIQINNLSDNMDSVFSFGENKENTLTTHSTKNGVLDSEEAYTTTGFEIIGPDAPRVSIEVERNGKEHATPNNNQYSASGEYIVTISNGVSNSLVRKIYVDNRKDWEIINNLVGQHFITGNRVYSEEEYPVYSNEGIQYLIQISDYEAPVNGFIRNEDTGESISFEQISYKTGTINTPGRYKAELIIGNGDGGGDSRIIDYYFGISSDDSYVPTINKERLAQYAHNSEFPDSIPLINDYGFDNSFSFQKDRVGLESNEILITDAEGETYSIEYDSSVAKQLEEQGCPSGIISITEKTVSGSAVEYNAAFIRSDENTSQITIDIVRDGEEASIQLTEGNDGEIIPAEEFLFAKLYDPLDPLASAIVSLGDEQWEVNGEHAKSESWTSEGQYKIEVTNQFGNTFSVFVDVEKVQSNGKDVSETSNTTNAAVQENSINEMTESQVQDEPADDVANVEKEKSPILRIAIIAVIIIALVTLLANRERRTKVAAIISVIVRLFIPKRK